MRKFVFCTLLAVLAALLIARSLLPEPASYVMASAVPRAYNLLAPAHPPAEETAGSGLRGELDAYFFSRAPTAKNALTGALQGRDLILICADSWAADPAEDGRCPALARLNRDSAGFLQVYRPDWYQGMDGREFALLTGIIPTRIDDGTALAWVGRQRIYLPFTLARGLGEAGYTSAAVLPGDESRAAYEALGFSELYADWDGAASLARRMIERRSEIEGPLFLFSVWPDTDCGEALALLLTALEEDRSLDDTVICLLTGNREPYQARLFLRARGISAAEAPGPCSDLDVTPTLLNLFGVPYDSRFLSGRDVFADSGVPGRASDITPLVTLFGSAYSDWVTDAGSYIYTENAFWRTGDLLSDTGEAAAYVRDICRLQYDRYIFSRRALEMDYYRTALAVG